jgi:hypothetical protein
MYAIQFDIKMRRYRNLLLKVLNVISDISRTQQSLKVPTPAAHKLMRSN